MLAQVRRQHVDDRAVAIVQGGRHGAGADVQVAARVVGRGHAQHRAQRLAVDQQDALVALAHLGQVALGHRPAAAEVGRLLQDRSGVGIALADVEDAEAARGVQRLDHHLAALLGQERAQAAGLAGDHHRRGQLGEAEHRQLLVRLAQAARVVDQQGLAARPLEQQGREVVVEVEGRVLAHEHDVEVVEEHLGLRPEQVVVAGDRPHRDRPGGGAGAVVLQPQVAGLAEPVLVPAGLRLQHQREGRVAGDLNPGQRIHHEEELHGSDLSPENRLRPQRCLVLPPGAGARRGSATGARGRACASGSTGSTG